MPSGGLQEFRQQRHDGEFRNPDREDAGTEGGQVVVDHFGFLRWGQVVEVASAAPVGGLC